MAQWKDVLGIVVGRTYLDNIVDVIYCEFAFLCLVEPTHVGFDFQCQLSHFALTFVGAFGVQDLQKKCSLDKLEGLEIKQSKKDFEGHHCIHTIKVR